MGDLGTLRATAETVRNLPPARGLDKFLRIEHASTGTTIS
jgi:hypothetical protein